MLDGALWHLTRHNPIELLRRVDLARLAACAQDPVFLERYDALIAWNGWVADTHDTWFETTYPDLAQRTIAYFCAEFGLHASVPIYSGGLGVLAGDHCKTASDLGVPLLGVGLYYIKGYRSEEHTSELQSLAYLVCRLLLEKKKHDEAPAVPLIPTVDIAPPHVFDAAS